MTSKKMRLNLIYLPAQSFDSFKPPSKTYQRIIKFFLMILKYLKYFKGLVHKGHRIHSLQEMEKKV